MAKIVVRREQLERRKQSQGIASDEQLASLVGVHPTQLSRVLSGRSAPGNKFIAGMLDVFGVSAFPDLFAVVPDDDGAAA